MIEQQKIILRKCVGCKEMIDISQLIRLSYNTTTSEVVINKQAGKKSPGRGAYVCKNEQCLAKAQKSNGISRSFKHAVPKEIYEQLKIEIVHASGVY